MIPQRLRLSRKKGFNLQRESLALNSLPAVKVTRPGLLGNPYRVTGKSDPGNGECATASEAVREYQEHYGDDPGFRKNVVIPELRGRNVGCWCACWHCQNGHEHGHEIHGHTVKLCPACGAELERVPCHADLLLRWANE